MMMKKVDNKFCLQNKKAQSQIITTVLIILLVLAAVVIVWQVVRTTVTEGTSTLEERTACIGLNFDITSVDITAVTNDLVVGITRTAGGPDGDVTLVLLVNGVTKTADFSCVSDTLGQLESTVCTDAAYGATLPTKVQVGGTTGVDNIACDFLACSGTEC